jgi:hypothetical protein
MSKNILIEQKYASTVSIDTYIATHDPTTASMYIRAGSWSAFIHRTMSNTKNTGGPAYPVRVPTPNYNFETVHQGMTLRDYFAANATEADIESVIKSHRYAHWSDREGAKYIYADRMLRAREQQTSTEQ